MGQQVMGVISTKRRFYILAITLVLSYCSNNYPKDSYSIKIHYQYIVYRVNEHNSYNVYAENFLNIKNNTMDTILVPYKSLESSLIMNYKNNIGKPFHFISNNQIKIAPMDSIDVNCAVDLKYIVKEIPSDISKEDYKIYNIQTKEYLPITKDYEIIRTTKFGVFKEHFFK